MENRKNPLIFMDVCIDGDPAERMVFELFYDIAPKTAENFRALSTGEMGVSSNTGKSLHYKGSFIHQILKGSIVRGGDFVNRNGTGGESIYGSKFPDELPRLKHDAPGLLSMAIADRETLGSHFIITLKADHHLDRKHVVFGKLVQGHNILQKIEEVGDEDGHPTVTVKIINCGEYNDDMKKINKLKMGRDVSSETNSQEVGRKVKLKKSSSDRRKRRKYYSSESESSDSDMESSEGDTDSDTDVSSSSYTSSSSDDRRRKRKRSSRKGNHKRGKRRDKRRDKRRRKRDKRSKHRSRRKSGSITDSDTESKSDNDTDIGNHAQGKDQKRKDHSQQAEIQSPLNGDNELSPIHKKQEELHMLVEEEFPKENGGCCSNGVGTNYRSHRIEERRPDIVEDNPGKSRSQSMSPKRSMSKSMSINPRNKSKSPIINLKRRLSTSPRGNNRSPRAPSRSLRSRSPVRSINRNPNKSVSRSPVKVRMGRSVSRSPVRTHDHRSVRTSPVRTYDRRINSRSPVRTHDRRSISKSPVTTINHRCPVRSRRSPMRSHHCRSVSKSPLRSLSHSHRSRSSSLPSQRTLSRSPVRESRKSISRSPVRSSARSFSRSSGRVPVRSVSRSPVRAPSRSGRHSYSRSHSPIRRTRTPHGRSVSRSVSPDASPKHIRRGRGFSERYSYARRYRTPSRSPVRSYHYNRRSDRDRYSGYRRYSPRRYRSPLRRGRTPPRYRGRRSRTPSVSLSPRYCARQYSRGCSPVRSRSPVRRHSPVRRRSPVRSRSPVEPYRLHVSPHVVRRTSLSWSRSPSRPRSSVESQSPRKGDKDNRSRSSSRSPYGVKGLVSYGDGSPDSSPR